MSAAGQGSINLAAKECQSAEALLELLWTPDFWCRMGLQDACRRSLMSTPRPLFNMLTTTIVRNSTGLHKTLGGALALCS